MPGVQRLCPWVVLIGAVTLLQVHGIAFWRAQLGDYGMGWSLWLDVVALWLWSRPSLNSRLLGAIASVLLLAGPLLQVGLPLLDRAAVDVTQAEAHRQALVLVQAEMDEQSKQLAAYTENAKHRSGWLPALQATAARLREAREHLVTLHRQTPVNVSEHTWQARGVVLMECLGLVLFQLTAVLALVQLSGRVPVGSQVAGLATTTPKPKPKRTRKSSKPKVTQPVNLTAVPGGKDAVNV